MLLREYRCHSCNKLLFKGILVESTIEVKCRGCGGVAIFQGEPKDKLLCYKEHCANRVLADGSLSGGNTTTTE